ncbi:hypothetical protein SS50377_26152 [Spironucleus salmonicida]|uniref:Uncharacterized protein n=1 Tax=Spironucleus salmonicida TaxID=348837 RepID=V6LJV5_9EUKA|nr:hypothetical protein SS50377_26152 [Spironucleus salmonicida]|eukprot:EST44885.1 Hypothetical protein SS50377_15176 [Spironucleus salmonicida]
MSRTQHTFKNQTEHNEQRIQRQIKRYQFQLALQTLQSLKNQSKKKFYTALCHAGLGLKFSKSDPLQSIFRAIFCIKNNELTVAEPYLKSLRNVPAAWKSAYHLACLELFREQGNTEKSRQEYPIFAFFEATKWQKERAIHLMKGAGEEFLHATESLQEGEASVDEEVFEGEEEEKVEIESVKEAV